MHWPTCAPIATVILCLFVAPAFGGEVAPPSASPRSAEVVYRQGCGYCHGRNVGPIILGRHLAVAYVRERVRAGVNAMPAFRPTEISEAELAAVAALIERSSADAEEHGQ